MTVIYPSPIFGPVRSRRLGISLGVNLMPGDGKWCSFDCIYCECGLNRDRKPSLPVPTLNEVTEKLESKLKEMRDGGEELDVITFSGNGEPTMHPHFAQVMNNVLALRYKYFPQAKVSVLSNSTQVHRKEIRQALMKADNAIMKLDTANMDYISLVDQPNGAYSLDKVVENLSKMDGKVIIQTIFMKGAVKDKDGNEVSVDNCSDHYITPYINTLKKIRPRKVMIYTLDREWPTEGLVKADKETMDIVAGKLRDAGFETSVSY